MKATFQKHGSQFHLDLTPETPGESLQLVRFGMNKTKSVKRMAVYVGETLPDTGLSIVIGAKKNESHTLE